MSKSYPELITSAVPVFFLVYDLEHHSVCYVSDSFFELVAGGRNNKSDNTNFWDYILQEDRETLKAFLSDLGEENNYTGRIEIKAKGEDKEVRNLELSMYPIEDSFLEKDAPPVLVGHLRDITSQKEQERKARQTLNSQNNIINILAHDLRAPFHHISSIIALLKTQMSPEDWEKYSKYLEMLDRIGQRSDELLDRITKISQLQAWSQQPDFKLYDLRKLVEQIVEEHLEEKDLDSDRVKLNLPDYAAEAEVDQILFKQIITNLLSNALKFTPDEKLIQINIQSRKNKDVVVEVKDEGMGIPKPKLNQLFTEPNTVKRKGLKGERSVGLGLQITRQLVELHRGELEVDSTEGKGSTFSVCIPLPDVSHATQGSKKELAR